MGEPRIKDNISWNRDVLSSISWATSRPEHVYIN